MTAPAGRDLLVADVGGTTFRLGTYDAATRTLAGVRRLPTMGLGEHPGTGAGELQTRAVEQITRELAAALREPGRRPAAAVGISFAGPVTSAGVVTGAPTVWGEGGAPLALGEVLRDRLGVPVVVVNDVTAAVWRYADRESEPFCLITVSSGIGNKVFRGGEVLVHPDGHGGEIGHWRVDTAPDAPPCDCGGRGHLGGLASGRGMLAAVRRAARLDPAAFAGSPLATPAGRDPDRITNPAVVSAVRADDPFTTGVLRAQLRHLASAIIAMFSSIGVRRFVIIGGFALAVGTRFVRHLTEQLLDLGCFGLSESQVRRMVSLGERDDDHGLLGVGRLLTSHLLLETPA